MDIFLEAAMSKGDMNEWKVRKDFGCGEAGPRPFDNNQKHHYNTLDWKEFHISFPQLHYFTEELIDLDSDAFAEDEYYCRRAVEILPYLAPFVEIVRVLNTSEAVILKQQINATETAHLDLLHNGS
jgi:hypothetical protein